MSASNNTGVKNINQENIDNSIQNNNIKPPKFPFLIRRFIEILAVSVICSVPIALIYQFGFTRSEAWAFRLIGTSFIAFILLNAYLLRAFFFSMGNRKIYYSVNAIAYLMFSVVNVATLFFIGDAELPSLYSYLFMPIKFTNVIINMITSTGNSGIQISCAIITHLIMLSIILISPLEMYSIDKKKR